MSDDGSMTSYWTVTSKPGQQLVTIDTVDGAIRLLRSELPDLIQALSACIPKDES